MINNFMITIFSQLFIGLLFSILFSIIFLYFGWKTNDWNGISPKEDKSLLDKFFNRFYFTIITLSTIGYGDITPKTRLLKVITIILALSLILTLITFLMKKLKHKIKHDINNNKKKSTFK